MPELNREKILNDLTNVVREVQDNIQEMQDSINLLEQKEMPGVAKMLNLAVMQDRKMLEKIEFIKAEILMNV